MCFLVSFYSNSATNCTILIYNHVVIKCSAHYTALHTGIKPIESVRVPPPADFSEHYLNSSEWALPTLLSWMPVETIVWALSLLLGTYHVLCFILCVFLQ